MKSNFTTTKFITEMENPNAAALGVTDDGKHVCITGDGAKNVLVVGESGPGKTICYVNPMLKRCIEQKNNVILTASVTPWSMIEYAKAHDVEICFINDLIKDGETAGLAEEFLSRPMILIYELYPVVGAGSIADTVTRDFVHLMRDFMLYFRRAAGMSQGNLPTDVFMIFDEFFNMGIEANAFHSQNGYSEFVDILELNHHGINNLCISVMIQSLQQAKMAFSGEDSALDAFLAVFPTQICMKTNDMETAGHFGALSEKPAERQKSLWKRLLSWCTEKEESTFMTPDEVRQMPEDTELVWTKYAYGSRPVLLHKNAPEYLSEN